MNTGDFMDILGKYTKKNRKDLIKMIKERQKQEKKVNKYFENRMKSFYTTKMLKENKKLLLENTMTIDSMEYQKIIMELKEKFPDMGE